MLGHGRQRRTSRPLTALLLGALLALSGGAGVASAAISIGDVTVSETAGGGVASFRVTRIAPLLAGSVTVAFATSDGTARAPGDYTAASGSLFFGSALLGAEQIQHVHVALRPDTLDEPAETFDLRLTGSAEIVDGVGVATILDDDPPPPPPPPPPPLRFLRLRRRFWLDC